MRVPEVRAYYDKLRSRSLMLCLKRLFDVIASTVLIVVLSPVMAAIALSVGLTSPGGVFFRQERITRYYRVFRIVKFRTMIPSDSGSPLTVLGDSRITRVGAFLRRYRLDEIPQLFNILTGTMTFVGARPEVARYVDAYEPAWRSTFLLRAGLTSRASVFFKDEERILHGSRDVDEAYVRDVLPLKMGYNLSYLEKFGAAEDLRIIFLTVKAVFIRTSAT